MKLIPAAPGATQIRIPLPSSPRLCGSKASTAGIQKPDARTKAGMTMAENYRLFPGEEKNTQNELNKMLTHVGIHRKTNAWGGAEKSGKRTIGKNASR